MSLDEEEDNDKDFEMNMDKIMSKFTNFNNVLGTSSENDDDEMEEHIMEDAPDDEDENEDTKGS